MAVSPSQETLALLDSISQLGEGLRNGENGAREGLLGACSTLIAELSHPSETMLNLMWAQPTHHSILRMGVEVKLFDAMRDIDAAGSKTAEIAAKCTRNVDPVLVGTTPPYTCFLAAQLRTSIGRMLRHLASMGTVRETGPDTYAPTPTSKALAEPAYQDTIVYIVDDFHPALQGIPSYFNTHGFKCPSSGIDGPFQHAFNCKGTHYFEYFQKFNPEMGKRFGSMMDMWSKGRPRWFDESFYPVQERLLTGAESGGTFLVDVGGGTGHDIVGLSEAFEGKLPGTLILQDRPEVIELAQVKPGTEKMAQDFLTEQQVKGKLHNHVHASGD
jgi:hypothetical protein